MSSRFAVTLPETIKCKLCGEVKTPKGYGNSQLDKLRSHLRMNKSVPKAVDDAGIFCRQCGLPKLEMFCVDCTRVKPYEKFSKAQRSKRDDAVCIECQKNRDDLDPEYAGGGSESDSDAYSDSLPSRSQTASQTASSRSQFSGGGSSGSSETQTIIQPRRGQVARDMQASSVAGSSTFGSSRQSSSFAPSSAADSSRSFARTLPPRPAKRPKAEEDLQPELSDNDPVSSDENEFATLKRKS